MHDHKREDPLTDLGYETRDTDMQAIGKATTIFFVFVFASFMLGFGILWLLVGNGNPVKGFNALKDRQATAPFMTNGPKVPYPVLQTNITTKTDIKELRQNETAILTTSGVVDASKGIYRIPIDRAIELTAQRGLPDTPSATSGSNVDQRSNIDQGSAFGRATEIIVAPDGSARTRGK